MPTPANGNASEKFRLPTTGVPLPLGKFLGLSGILTEESFTIRQILLVGQERPSKKGSENSRCNSSVPADRVNQAGLYHVNACLQRACCGSAARTEMRFPAVYEQADRTPRRHSLPPLSCHPPWRDCSVVASIWAAALIPLVTTSLKLRSIVIPVCNFYALGGLKLR